MRMKILADVMRCGVGVCCTPPVLVGDTRSIVFEQRFESLIEWAVRHTHQESKKLRMIGIPMMYCIPKKSAKCRSEMLYMYTDS